MSIIFIVSRPGRTPENVILSARDREAAKRASAPILGGDKEHYVVEPITRHGHHTVFLLDSETNR